MRFTKSNVIYIDFLFRRKKLNSKPMIFLYKIYSIIRKGLFLPSSTAKTKGPNYFSSHKSSNY